jgi:UDP-glucose 4-epimerase
VFNVGSDEPMTIAALADLVVETLKSKSNKRFLPYDRAYNAGFEDLRQRQPDLARIRAAVGFRPQRTLRGTIRDLADAMSQTAGACR